MQVSASQTARLTQLIPALAPDPISCSFILKRRFAGCVPAFISPLASLMASIDWLAESENSRMALTPEYWEYYSQASSHTNTHASTDKRTCTRAWHAQHAPTEPHTQQSAASNTATRHPRLPSSRSLPACGLPPLFPSISCCFVPSTSSVSECQPILKSKCRLFSSSPKRLGLGYDAWCGVAHGCTKKLGMKICGKLDGICLHSLCLHLLNQLYMYK